MKPEPSRTWLIERAALGEAPNDAPLTPEEARKVIDLRADNEAILAKHRPLAVAAEVKRRAGLAESSRPPRRAARATFIAAPVLAAAAAVLLMVNVPPEPPDGVGAASTADRAAPLEITRIKGAALLAHRKTSRGSESLHSGDRVGPGDRLQLSVRLDAPSHVAIVSVDGRGVTTLHLPADAASAPPRFEAGTTPLDFSYELDDAPAFERFFLVTATEAFDVRTVLRAAETLAQLPTATASAASLNLPDSMTHLDLRLRKDDF